MGFGFIFGFRVEAFGFRTPEEPPKPRTPKRRSPGLRLRTLLNKGSTNKVQKAWCRREIQAQQSRWDPASSALLEILPSFGGLWGFRLGLEPRGLRVRGLGFGVQGLWFRVQTMSHSLNKIAFVVLGVARTNASSTCS